MNGVESCHAPVLVCPVLSCPYHSHVESCTVMSSRVLSCPCPSQSCPVLSIPAQSYRVESLLGDSQKLGFGSLGTSGELLIDLIFFSRRSFRLPASLLIAFANKTDCRIIVFFAYIIFFTFSSTLAD